MGKQWNQWETLLFLGSKIIADGDCSHEIKRCLILGRKAMTNLDNLLKKQRHYFADKGLSSQSYGFSSSHVWMWGLDHKEGRVPNNWCFQTVVLEETLKSPTKIKPDAENRQKEAQGKGGGLGTRVCRSRRKMNGSTEHLCVIMQLHVVAEIQGPCLKPRAVFLHWSEEIWPAVTSTCSL